jgi:hypothetical protein
MVDDSTEWVRAKDAPRVFPPLSYQEIYRACIDGKIKAEQRGRAAWYCWRADLEKLQSDRAANEFSSSAVPPSYDDLQEPIREIQLLSVKRQVYFNTLEADRREALARGDDERAETIRQIVESLQACQYEWDGKVWVCILPGVARVSARSIEPVPPRERTPA